MFNTVSTEPPHSIVPPGPDQSQLESPGRRGAWAPHTPGTNHSLTFWHSCGWEFSWGRNYIWRQKQVGEQVSGTGAGACPGPPTSLSQSGPGVWCPKLWPSAPSSWVCKFVPGKKQYFCSPKNKHTQMHWSRSRPRWEYWTEACTRGILGKLAHLLPLLVPKLSNDCDRAEATSQPELLCSSLRLGIPLSEATVTSFHLGIPGASKKPGMWERLNKQVLNE